jgi:hypothetical protein
MEGLLVQVTAAWANAMMAMAMNRTAMAKDMAAMRVAKCIQILLIYALTLVVRPNGLLAP